MDEEVNLASALKPLIPDSQERKIMLDMVRNPKKYNVKIRNKSERLDEFTEICHEGGYKIVAFHDGNPDKKISGRRRSIFTTSIHKSLKTGGFSFYTLLTAFKYRYPDIRQAIRAVHELLTESTAIIKIKGLNRELYQFKRRGYDNKS